MVDEKEYSAQYEYRGEILQISTLDKEIRKNNIRMKIKYGDWSNIQQSMKKQQIHTERIGRKQMRHDYQYAPRQNMPHYIL